MSLLAHAVLLMLALAAALSVRPWRLLQAGTAHPGFLTPALACLVLLTWMWAWPGQAGVPLALQWSGAPLAVLLLGWPLAIPVLAVAAASTVWTADASAAEALRTAVQFGVLPATAMLVLGQCVRRACGHQPLAYIGLRGFVLPMAIVAACSLANPGLAHVHGEVRWVATFLLALAEASWTCAIAALLVAGRPQWLATWSEALYFPRPQAVRSRR